MKDEKRVSTIAQVGCTFLLVYLFLGTIALVWAVIELLKMLFA